MTVLWFDTVFPPSLIAMGCIFRFIGGGSPVLLGIILSMISDVISEDKRSVLRLYITKTAMN